METARSQRDKERWEINHETKAIRVRKMDFKGGPGKHGLCAGARFPFDPLVATCPRPHNGDWLSNVQGPLGCQAHEDMASGSDPL